MASVDEVIVSILKENDCYGQAKMIEPKKLMTKCGEKGFSSEKQIEAALVRLIDTDVIDYEMDDDLNTTQIWLL